MEVREKLNFTCLREEEAWELFQEKVGQETISSPPIKVLALELVKELKGLPLALEVIGRAMYGKDDPSRWESAIDEMKLSRCEKDDREPLTKVFIQLKYSYDNLRNNNLRDCFLTCALWPEDKRISKVELAQCWMGLGLVDEGDIQRSYTKAYSLIGDLRDASLIQSCGNWYGYVKLHDVIRDMALWIACGCGENNDKWFVRSRVGKHEQLNIPWSKAEYISLIGNKTYEFPPSDFNPCLMKLRVLRLRSYGLGGSIDHQPLKRFTSMTYLDLSSNHMKNIPDELFSLVNLEHLDLSNNNLIEQAPDCLRNLIKLKFLYLLHSGIRTIPEGVILNLRALQVIDLRTCQIFGGGSPEDFNHTVCGELGTLPDLKAASIGVDDFAECESLSGASNLPIRSLRLWGLTGRPAFHLSDISSLGFVQRTLYELVIRRGKMEKITESHQLSGKKYDFPTLNKITLSLLTNLKETSWTGISRAASVFPKLSFLHVHNCPKLEDLPWVIYLPCLERLEITFCSMKQAFPKPIPHGTFSCLKHLHLSHNSKLVTICDPEVTFPSLEKLVIGDCPQMKRLPFKMHSLPLKLQELRFHEVKYWEKLEWEEGVKSFLQPTLIIGREDYVS